MSLTSLSQSTGRYAAIALGAALPISVALDNVLFFVIVLAWLASGRWREKMAALRNNPPALTALALLGLLVLGTAWGPGSAGEAWYYIAKYKDLVLLAALSGLFLSHRDGERALDAFLAAMALTLVISYAIWIGVVPVDNPPDRYAGNPTVFKKHITHGVLMALAAFLAADRALRAPDRGWRIAYAAGALLAACNVFMVQGRTGYVVFAALALYFGVAHWRWRGIAGALAAIAVVLGIAYFADASIVGRSATAAIELRQWSEGGAGETSMGLRMNYYKTTLAIVRDNPVLGVGTGGFEAAYREKIKGTDLPESNNPHNQYLLTAAQLGAVGLGVLLGLFVVMWREASRLEPAAKLAARGLVLAIAVGCLFNSFLIDHVEGLLFAWMAGVLFSKCRYS